jgi:ribonuclease HII
MSARVAGVDEAGKGPVLGSMFAAAVVAVPEDLPDGVGDSKELSPARRETLAAAIRDASRVSVAEVPVARIDDPETDMNTLTVAAQAEALAPVVADGTQVRADAGDTDAARFGRRVADRLDADASVTAAHGADADDPVVGAASIVAKVARDAHVAALDDAHDRDVGSGYPSDPTTREFLAAHVREHGDVPDCARRSWATCGDVVAAAEQSRLDAF